MSAGSESAYMIRASIGRSFCWGFVPFLDGKHLLPLLLIFAASGANAVQIQKQKSQPIDYQLRFLFIVPRTRLELTRP